MAIKFDWTLFFSCIYIYIFGLHDLKRSRLLFFTSSSTLLPLLVACPRMSRERPWCRPVPRTRVFAFQFCFTCLCEHRGGRRVWTLGGSITSIYLKICKIFQGRGESYFQNFSVSFELVLVYWVLVIFIFLSSWCSDCCNSGCFFFCCFLDCFYCFLDFYVLGFSTYSRFLYLGEWQ